MGGLVLNMTNWTMPANLSALFNLSRSSPAWYEDDGSMEWLFVASFIWVVFSTLCCLLLFLCNGRVRANRSNLLSLNLLLSILINEVFMSVTIIYHDAIGIPHHWTFGVHYCRFVILAQTFSVSLQSYTVLLITVDTWFRMFSPARYNEQLVSRRVFAVLAASPVTLAVLGVLFITLPMSPTIGRLMTYKAHTFCFLDTRRGDFRCWVIVFVVVNFLLPSSLSFVLAGGLVVALCRRLAAYQSFSGAPSGGDSMRDGENRMKHVIVSTFVMNALFICLSGPFVWSRLTKNYSIYKDSLVVYRVYWCLLPLVWLMLQPELVAVVTSSVRRCWRLGPRKMVSSCVDRIRGRSANGSSGIREYNVHIKPDVVENDAL